MPVAAVAADAVAAAAADARPGIDPGDAGPESMALGAYRSPRASRRSGGLLARASPLQAADGNVLARILLSRRPVATASLRPSLRGRWPRASAAARTSTCRSAAVRSRCCPEGTVRYGITEDGGAIIGGIVRWLPEVVGALAPSLLSGFRLQPGHWSGAFACWGFENREAAVRLCAATPGNPRGASIEVKCVDASANPYVVNAVLLGLARRALTGPGCRAARGDDRPGLALG